MSLNSAPIRTRVAGQQDCAQAVANDSSGSPVSKLILIAPSLVGHPDRISYFLSGLGVVDELLFLSNDFPAAASLGDDVEYRAPKSKKKGWAFFRWAAREALTAVRQFPGRVIVIELGTSFALALLRVQGSCRSGQVRLMQMVVTPTVSARACGLWRGDRYSPRMSLRQSLWWRKQIELQFLSLCLARFVADGFVANSEHIKAELAGLRCPLRVWVMRNVAERRLTIQFGADSDRPFVYLGRLQPYKGLGVLLEGYRQYRRSGGKRSLRVVGSASRPDREWAARLMRAYQEQEGITYVEAVPHSGVAELLARASAVISCSLVEGSPRVVLEALAVGSKVIASDIPAIRDLVSQGAPISMFRSEDPDSLALRLGLHDEETLGVGGANGVWQVDFEFAKSDLRELLSNVFRTCGRE